MPARPAPATIDDYIAGFPPGVRSVLAKVRAAVRNAAPNAEERISYRMPAFFQGGVLIYFAAFKNHVGVYPPVSGDENLVRAVAPYRGEKGNLRFPLDRPIPYTLIGRIVRARLKERAGRPGAVPRRAARA